MCFAFIRIFVANITYNPPSMQTLKDHTRRTIMDVARTAFLEDGFLKASMRSVATATGTSLGNLYNYFPSKDALFTAVVEPFIAEMEHLLESYYGLTAFDMLQWNTPQNIQKTTETYLSLVREHRDLMFLVFYRAQGSSLEAYRHEFIDKCSGIVSQWFSHLTDEQGELRTQLSNAFIRWLSAGMFSMIEEIIDQNMNEEAAEKFIEEYLTFEIEGIKALLSRSQD